MPPVDIVQQHTLTFEKPRCRLTNELARGSRKNCRSDINVSWIPWGAQTNLSTGPRTTSSGQNLISYHSFRAHPFRALSPVFPDPPHSDHFTRFCIRYDLRTNSSHRERTKFDLKALTMASWQCLKLFQPSLETVSSALAGDLSLTITEKYPSLLSSHTPPPFFS